MTGVNQKRLVLQFHITGRCNLRCKHCYRLEGDVEPLTLQDVKNVIDQFLELQGKYNAAFQIRKRGHINLTGGEPFCRGDIEDILRYLGQQSDRVTYGVLTNGSFIDAQIISLLRETKVSFVQLSLDGDEKTHDSLRKQGDYQRVFRVAQLLVANGIRTYVSFTANKQNMRFLPKVASECRKYGVDKLWSDRLVPIGHGKEMQTLEITKEDLPIYLRYLKKAQGNPLIRRLFPKTAIPRDRALQFMCGGSMYSCSAGKSLITVDEYGRIMPCRRMPILCGDVFTSSLQTEFFKNPVFVDLQRSRIPQECANCAHKLFCRGGAKCQSYAKTGDFHRADPACPLCMDVLRNTTL